MVLIDCFAQTDAPTPGMEHPGGKSVGGVVLSAEEATDFFYG